MIFIVATIILIGVGTWWAWDRRARFHAAVAAYVEALLEGDVAGMDQAEAYLKRRGVDFIEVFEVFEEDE